MSVRVTSRHAPSVLLFVVMFLVLSVTALYAGTPADNGAAAQPTAPAAASAASATTSPLAQPLPLLPPQKPIFATHRPAALVPLYVSFATLQALDVRSTMTALGNGASEANPLLGGITQHTDAFLALKMGAAAGTIFVSEKLWKRNPVAAVALMVGLNSAYAVVVAHNYRVAGGLH
ncbi:MAG TPA: DUF5658 family protein [Vicinamibacterales bacterium]|jgi:hypothetical protein